MRRRMAEEGRRIADLCVRCNVLRVSNGLRLRPTRLDSACERSARAVPGASVHAHRCANEPRARRRVGYGVYLLLRCNALTRRGRLGHQAPALGAPRRARGRSARYVQALVHEHAEMRRHSRLCVRRLLRSIHGVENRISRMFLQTKTGTHPLSTLRSGAAGAGTGMMFRLVPLSALGDFVNSSYFTPDYAGGFVEYTGAACVSLQRPAAASRRIARTQTCSFSPR